MFFHGSLSLQYILLLSFVCFFYSLSHVFIWVNVVRLCVPSVLQTLIVLATGRLFSSSQLDFSQCQPLEKSCKRCWDTSHNDSIIAIYSFCVWNSMEDDGGVCVCFSSMFVSGFLRRLRWKWVAIKQHITLKLLLTSVLPGRFWLKWSMPIPPLKLRDLKREVGPKESSCQSQKCGFSLFGSPCPSLEGQAKRKWSQTHWLKNLRQRCLVFFLVES